MWKGVSSDRVRSKSDGKWSSVSSTHSQLGASRAAPVVVASSEDGSGSGDALTDCTVGGRWAEQHRYRAKARMLAADGGQVAAAVSRSRPRRSVGRAAATPPAPPGRCASGTGAAPHFGAPTGSGHAIVHTRHVTG